MLYSQLDLKTEIQKAIERMGFTELTEIQEKAIPPMLEGHDIIAKAPTGTGKTTAFGIPLLLGIDVQKIKTQALVLAPTRELAQQITDEISELAHFIDGFTIACLYGGQPIGKQITKLKTPPHLVVATPGRLMDHMQRKTISVTDITSIVLDEADEMLDMGFYKDVVKILDSIKNRKQLGMFSATISREVMDIGWLYQRDAVEITVHPVQQSMPKIQQFALETTGRNKLADVAEIIVNYQHERVMAFCNTKYTTEMLTNQLVKLNFNVACLHGDLNQRDRNKIMESFRKGEIHILVSTDVAARGIDVDDVDAVINYDLPPSNEYYTHRIGRTGRAKREGVAYVLYMPDEKRRLKEMARLTRNTIIPVRFDAQRKLVQVPEL